MFISGHIIFYIPAGAPQPRTPAAQTFPFRGRVLNFNFFNTLVTAAALNNITLCWQEKERRKKKKKKNTPCVLLDGVKDYSIKSIWRRK